jgi:hypothetical protein
MVYGKHVFIEGENSNLSIWNIILKKGINMQPHTQRILLLQRRLKPKEQQLNYISPLS